MKNRLTLLMTVSVLAGFAIILLLNMASLFGIIPSKYISPNDVRGMAVSHSGKLYTLNFAQQNNLVEIFNRALPVSKADIEKRQVSPPNAKAIQKIIIYRFNAPDIEITPVAYVSKSTSAIGKNDELQVKMVFSTPAWNANAPLEESATDAMYTVLQTTYDP